MGLIEEIGVGPVAIDTSAFIYFIEKHKVYHRVIRPVFEAIANGTLEGITTVVTLTEALTLPLKEGNFDLVEEYSKILLQSGNITLIDKEIQVIILKDYSS